MCPPIVPAQVARVIDLCLSSPTVLDRRFLAPTPWPRWAAETPDAVALEHVDGERSDLRRAARPTPCGGPARCASVRCRRRHPRRHHAAQHVRRPPVDARPSAGSAPSRCRSTPRYTGRMLHYALDHSDATVLDRRAGVPRAGSRPSRPTCPDWRRSSSPTAAPGRRRRCPRRRASTSSSRGTSAGRPTLTGPDAVGRRLPAVHLGHHRPVEGGGQPVGAVVYQMWSWVPDDTVAPGEGCTRALPMFHNSGRSAFNYALTRAPGSSSATSSAPPTSGTTSAGPDASRSASSGR